MKKNDIHVEPIEKMGEDANRFHRPVLCDEILSFCKEKTLQRVLDGTIGFGGHAEKIIDAHPEIELYVGLDQDITAVESAKKRLEKNGPKVLVQHVNFSSPRLNEISGQFDLILLDIGVSSVQLDSPERGFSFMKEGPLDMRMNQDPSIISAEEIINRASEKELADIFFRYGEEPRSRIYAKAICEKRRKEKFYTTLQLAKCIETISPRRGKIHPATLLFQALRIAVNRELEVLEKALDLYPLLLSKNGGRFMVISFHSLEDRIVKKSFQKYARSVQIEAESSFQLVTKKPIVASLAEIRANPRARSAKLRILERRDV